MNIKEFENPKILDLINQVVAREDYIRLYLFAENEIRHLKEKNDELNDELKQISEHLLVYCNSSDVDRRSEVDNSYKVHNNSAIEHLKTEIRIMEEYINDYTDSPFYDGVNVGSKNAKILRKRHVKFCKRVIDILSGSDGILGDKE